jgi:hypothetical protein
MLNIFSGGHGLGAALTNPTELAFRKGAISARYPVLFRGVRYPDVESAYHQLKVANALENDDTMISLIACKFRQHPALSVEVVRQGGAAWLATCSHLTGAKSPSAMSWEGHGRESRFIRNLVAGFELSQSDQVVGEAIQSELF